MSLPIAQHKNMLKKWVAHNHVTKEMNEFNTNVTKMMNETKNNVTRVVSQLSAVLDRKLRIMQNEALTPLEHKQALGNLSAEFPEAYRVLEWTHTLFMPCDWGCGNCIQSGGGRGKGGGRGRGRKPGRGHGHGRGRGRASGRGRGGGSGRDRRDWQAPVSGEGGAMDRWLYHGHSTPSYRGIRYDSNWSQGLEGGYFGNGRMRSRYDSRGYSQELDSDGYDVYWK